MLAEIAIGLGVGLGGAFAVDRVRTAARRPAGSRALDGVREPAAGVPGVELAGEQTLDVGPIQVGPRVTHTVAGSPAPRPRTTTTVVRDSRASSPSSSSTTAALMDAALSAAVAIPTG